MEITPEILHRCIPAASITNCTFAAPHLEKAFFHYKIDTPRRRGMLLANIAHESNNLKAVVENLNYSFLGLLKVFPNYFNPEQAQEYSYHPEKIANRVYANRYGNGDELSGDGWQYRGRGYIQTTFKDNYLLCAKEFGKTLGDVVDWLETPAGASWSAAFYWHRNAISTIADKPDTWKGDRGKYKGLTPFQYTCVMINGGNRGLKDREANYDRIKAVLGE